MNSERLAGVRIARITPEGISWQPLIGIRTSEQIPEPIAYPGGYTPSQQEESMIRGIARLSPSERTLFPHLIQGLSNDEIAAELSLSPATVRGHLSHIFLKMNITNRTALGVRAYQWSTIPEEVREFALEKFRETPKENPDALLTTREIEILELVKDGLENKEIGVKLVLSAQTVKNHITNILQKTGLRHRTQAVVFALKEGLISFNPE